MGRVAECARVAARLIADRRLKTAWIDRSREILRLFGGMNTAMTQICAGYTDDELEVIAGFVRRTAEAAAEAATELPPA